MLKRNITVKDSNLWFSWTLWLKNYDLDSHVLGFYLLSKSILVWCMIVWSVNDVFEPITSSYDGLQWRSIQILWQYISIIWIRTVWGKISYLKSAARLFFKLSANIHGLGLSNELLFIIKAQEAAKMWSVKVGDPKKLPYALPIYLVKSPFDSTWARIFSDLQLWQVTVLQSLVLWWWLVTYLKILSHIYLHLI